MFLEGSGGQTKLWYCPNVAAFPCKCRNSRVAWDTLISLIESAVMSRVGPRRIGSSFAQLVPETSKRQARDGSVLWWGTKDAPGPPQIVSPGRPTPITVAVSPVRPGQSVSVEHRANGGPIRQVTAVPLPGPYNAAVRLFHALLPGQPSGLIDFLPVLRFAGQPVSPRLTESTDYPRYQVGNSKASDPTALAAPAIGAASSETPGLEPRGKPRWDWNTRLLWTSSIGIRKEVIGKVPDGLRINWYFTDGHFVGPDHEGVVLPGGGDFMRIRHDGIGIVNVITEMMQTRTGARLYCSYGGMFDLGPDGYARAMRNEFDAFPPFVTSPTYTTADKEFAWLNRAQCLGLGRVDTNAMRIEADVYVVSVEGRKSAD
jgi:uncharacterized protein DUF3237